MALKPIRRITTALALGFGLALLVRSATPPVPRPAEEFVFRGPGSQIPLTSLRGKVVLIEFLLTNCKECQELSKVLTKVSTDLGPQGLQVMGVALDADDPRVQQPFSKPQTAADKAANYGRKFGIGFPVVSSSPEEALRVLGLPGTELFTTPQVMIIDREGVVRAQSEQRRNTQAFRSPVGSNGKPALEDEVNLRMVLANLLRSASNTLPTGPVPSQTGVPSSQPPVRASIPGPLPYPTAPAPPSPANTAALGDPSNPVGSTFNAALGISLQVSQGGPPTVVGIRARSPAERAGLRSGDLLLSIQGTALADQADLSGILRNFKQGDRVQMVVLRGGQPLILTAALGGASAP